jgi:hypothetical protein
LEGFFLVDCHVVILSGFVMSYKQVTYFCRCHYNEDTGHLRPLNDDARSSKAKGKGGRGRSKSKEKDNDSDDDSSEGEEEDSGIHASPLVLPTYYFSADVI